ncbi:hypothetical protein CFOL_v3_10591 [Cephalotus follicularis]|uniref:Zf-RVT domain-containing protein n=1 Tax=Cephalotus follicularis TaxID=3775 RepID=A0A1Q3BGU8_CEPFO|nr:hypothetical protein CFOL_v3_10591 [Cephalotus follicularis]
MVWKEVLGLCDIGRPILPWADEVEWMCANASGNQFHQTLRKLALAASIYHLWIERNNRCFKNHFLPYQDIVQNVRQDVSDKLALGNNAKKCDQHHSLCLSWGIPITETM